MANFFVNSQTLLQFTKSLVKCAENLHVEVYDYDVIYFHLYFLCALYQAFSKLCSKVCDLQRNWAYLQENFFVNHHV